MAFFHGYGHWLNDSLGSSKVFVCPHCRFRGDRDVCAAANIFAKNARELAADEDVLKVWPTLVHELKTLRPPAAPTATAARRRTGAVT